MSGSRLSDLQIEVLATLSVVEDGWQLIGGGALIAAHGAARSTNDLDVVWFGADQLDERRRRNVRDELTAAGMSVEVIQSGRSFERLLVRSGVESVLVDLMAERFQPESKPISFDLPSTDPARPPATILVAPIQELLVDKLCALLGRLEVRDLADVRHLLMEGGDLEGAVENAPRRDAGFSALTLSWLLASFPVRELAAAEGYSTEATDELEEFRTGLVERLTALSAPE